MFYSINICLKMYQNLCLFLMHCVCVRFLGPSPFGKEKKGGATHQIHQNQGVDSCTWMCRGRGVSFVTSSPPPLHFDLLSAWCPLVTFVLSSKFWQRVQTYSLWRVATKTKSEIITNCYELAAIAMSDPQDQLTGQAGKKQADTCSCHKFPGLTVHATTM